MQPPFYGRVIIIILAILFAQGSIVQQGLAKQVTKQDSIKGVSNSVMSHELGGVDLLNRKHYQEAANYYEQLLHINGPSADNFNYLALAMAGLKAYEQAFKDFAVALSIDPHKAVVHINRGDLFFSLNNFDKAIQDYSQAIVIDPSSIRAYDARAKTYNLTGQYQKAIADYSKLQALDVRHAGIYLDNRAYSYRKIGNYGNAIKDISEAISRDPKVPLLYLDRAAIFIELNRHREALADYDKAIQINPTAKIVFLSRANCYLQMGDFQKAMSDCNYVKRLKPDRHEASVLSAIAATVMNIRGEPLKALELASQAINADPSLAEGYLEHALACKRLRQFPQVVQDCDRVISINPQKQEAYICRAEALEHLAEQDRKIAYQLKPTH